MDYGEKKPDYKESGGEKKYYVVEEKKPEDIVAAPTFDQIFRNVPKGGSIGASPRFHRGIVYFSSLDTHVYAVDATTGEMIWKFKTGAPALSHPLVHNNRLYFGSNDECFYCLSLTGELMWKKHLGDIIISCPLGIGNDIFVSVGKIFFCLSEEGKEKWRFIASDGLYTPAAVNGTIFVGCHHNNLYALSMDGKLKWKFITGGGTSSPTILSNNKSLFTTIFTNSWDEMPVADKPMLYFVSADNNLYAIKENSELIWKFNCGSSFSSRVNSDGYTLYAGNVAGYIYAVDALTGQKKWSFRTGGIVSSAPTIDKGKIYVCSWDQKIYCLSESGEKIWDFLTGGPVAAESIVVGNKVYFGSADTFLYCLNIEKRTVEWTFQCGFGLPETLQAKITDVANAFTEYDKKIFRVWRPEIARHPTADFGLTGLAGYSTPSGFKSGISTYFPSSAAYKSSPTYLSKKRKPYDK